MNKHVKIRKAQQAYEFKAAFALVKELADYERALDKVIISEEQFVKDGMGVDAKYQLYVAVDNATSMELLPKPNSIPKIVGICLFYTMYSTWNGEILYLDDLVVTKAYRRRGVGKLLINELLQYAHSIGVNQVRWHVLDWNKPAIAFYRQLNMHLDEEWISCKMDKATLQQHISNINR